jgi:hypothetical protein
MKLGIHEEEEGGLFLVYFFCYPLIGDAVLAN